MLRQVRLNDLLFFCLLLLLCTELLAQGVAVPGDTCKPRVREGKRLDAGSWPTIPSANSQNHKCSGISMRTQHASRRKRTRDQ